MVSLGQKSYKPINTARRPPRVTSYLQVISQQLTCPFLSNSCCQLLLIHIHTCIKKKKYLHSMLIHHRLYSMNLWGTFSISFTCDAKWRYSGWLQIFSYFLCLVDLVQFFCEAWVLINFSVPNWLLLITQKFLQWLYIFIQITNTK